MGSPTMSPATIRPGSVPVTGGRGTSAYWTASVFCWTRRRSSRGITTSSGGVWPGMARWSRTVWNVPAVEPDRRAAISEPASCRSWATVGSRRCSTSVATFRPTRAWSTAASRFARSTPPATLSTRKTPMTSVTIPATTTVVAPTRSCSDRRQASPTAAAARRATPLIRARATRERGTVATPSAAGALVTASRCGGSRRPRLVPDAADGQHDLRTLRIPLDLGPQPLDVDVDQPGVRGVPIAPHLLQQHLAGEHLPRLPGQCHQQVELERGQPDGCASAADLVGLDVDLDRRILRPDRQGLGGDVLVVAQSRPHAGDQLLRLERLDDVVVGTGFEPQHDVHGVGLGRQHDDRRPALGPDRPAYVDARDARQH